LICMLQKAYLQPWSYFLYFY